MPLLRCFRMTIRTAKPSNYSTRPYDAIYILSIDTERTIHKDCFNACGITHGGTTVLMQPNIIVPSKLQRREITITYSNCLSNGLSSGSKLLVGSLGCDHSAHPQSILVRRNWPCCEVIRRVSIASPIRQAGKSRARPTALYVFGKQELDVF